MVAARGWFLAGIGLTLVHAHALAGPAPKFKTGLWEFDSTLVINGKEMHRKDSNCNDPNADMQEFLTAGGVAGCKWGAATQSGNTFTQSSVCSNGWRKERVRTVLGDSAYDEVNEDITPKSRMKETVHAHRVGACTN